MLLAALSRTLKQILSQDSNCETIFEKKKHRQVAENEGATGKGRAEESVSSIHAGSTQETLPDPWYN
jgi:hypothetical protein